MCNSGGSHFIQKYAQCSDQSGVVTWVRLHYSNLCSRPILIVSVHFAHILHNLKAGRPSDQKRKNLPMTYLHSSCNSSKDGVLSIEVLCGCKGNEELRSIRVRS